LDQLRARINEVEDFVKSINGGTPQDIDDYVTLPTNSKEKRFFWAVVYDCNYRTTSTISGTFGGDSRVLEGRV
jgi:hypothetical protein